MNNELKIPFDNFDHLAKVLILFVILFFTIALILYVITLFKRLLRIKNEALKSSYQRIVDKAIFAYLFGGDDIKVKDINIFNFNFTDDSLFQKVAIKSIVSLHHSYSGEYQEKLQSFYVQSKLVNYSLRMLDSKSWFKKVEGIRDLSTLKYQPALDNIKLCLLHKHELVQSEALIALVKMNGITELIQQKNSNLYLNDWIQSNLIFTIKTNRINDTGELNQLLTSENASFQLLGVRLIYHYHDSTYLESLKVFESQTDDIKLKSEISETINHINSFYNKLI